MAARPQSGCAGHLRRYWYPPPRSRISHGAAAGRGCAALLFVAAVLKRTNVNECGGAPAQPRKVPAIIIAHRHTSREIAEDAEEAPTAIGARTFTQKPGNAHTTDTPNDDDSRDNVVVDPSEEPWWSRARVLQVRRRPVYGTMVAGTRPLPKRGGITRRKNLAASL